MGERWVGIYHVTSDTFDVFRNGTLQFAKLKAALMPSGSYDFTEHEESSIERAAQGRDQFEWTPGHGDLTENSRAYWAMM